jgi:hypothetical protein
MGAEKEVGEVAQSKVGEEKESLDLYEDLVQLYLTVFEDCAIRPQVPIRKSLTGEDWEAYPDFLAIDFKKRRILIVEVSKAADRGVAGKFAEKLRSEEYRSNVEHYLRNTTLNNHLNDFMIQWRFFVRRANVSVLESGIREFIDTGQAEVTTLEDVFDTIRNHMP